MGHKILKSFEIKFLFRNSLKRCTIAVSDNSNYVTNLFNSFGNRKPQLFVHSGSTPSHRWLNKFGLVVISMFDAVNVNYVISKLNALLNI